MNGLHSILLRTSTVGLCLVASLAAALSPGEEEDRVALALVGLPHVGDGRACGRAVVYGGYSGSPRAGVPVAFSVTVDEDEEPVLAGRVETNGLGVAEYCFDVPSSEWYADLDAQVELAGRELRGSLSYYGGSASGEVQISTDKVLYRPGQRLRVRAVFLDSRGRAEAGRPVRLSLLGSGDRTSLESRLTTSDFGVASTSWRLPDSLPPGSYSVRALRGGGEEGYARASVRVADYELPRFSVEARSVQPYFLPTETPGLEISVVSRAGESMAGVRLEVLEGYRQKNLVGSGVTDEEGRAAIDLDLVHGLGSGPYSSRFRDVDLTIAATDPVSDRVARSSITVRLTHEEIHLYLIGSEPDDGRGWNATQLVTASYADGSPAVCDVTIRPREGDKDLQPIEVTTNAYGVAAVPGHLALARLAIAGEGLEVVARDQAGRTGRVIQEDSWWDPDDEVPAVWLSVDRALQAAGEPLTATLHSAGGARSIVVEAYRDDVLLDSRMIESVGVERLLEFPSVETTPGVVEIVAYSLDPLEIDEDWSVWSSARVLYAGSELLELDLSSDAEVYKPGEEVQLVVRTGEGSASGPGFEAVVGLIALDSAVGEVRDEQSGRLGREAFRGNLTWVVDDGAELAGWTTSRLEALSQERLAEPDLQLVAAAVASLSGAGSYIEVDTDTPQQADARYLHRSLQPDAERLRRALHSKPTLENYTVPVGGEAIDVLSHYGLDPASFVDPWGGPLRWSVRRDGGHWQLRGFSAGRDGDWRSADDLRALTHHWSPLAGVAKELEERLGRAFVESGAWVATAAEMDDLVGTEALPQGYLETLLGPGVGLRVELTPYGYVAKLYSAERLLPWQLRPKVSKWLVATVTSRLLAAFGSEWQSEEPESVEAQLRRLVAERGWIDPWSEALEVDFLLVGHDSAEPRIETVILSSRGADRERLTADDIELASIGSGVSLVSSPRATVAEVGATLVVRASDDSGAELPGVSVMVTCCGESWASVTGADGTARLPELPPGTYTLEIALEGFSTAFVTDVELEAGHLYSVSVTLVAAIEETIVVTSESPLVQTPATSRRVPSTPRRISTPRLREDFPEVLVWLPEIRVGPERKAVIPVALADNVTAWEFAAIASTRDGRFAYGEHRVLSTQPFYVELDYPRKLTVGDRVDVPLMLYNLTPEPDAVNVKLYQGLGLEFEGERAILVELHARDRQRVDLPLRASAAGSPRVEVQAEGRTHSDALRREFEVIADGRLVQRVESRLLGSGEEIHVEVPESAIPGTPALDVKVYGGVADQLVEATAALVRRPTGCAEQTLSLAWPSLLWLEMDGAETAVRSEETDRAEAFVLEALRALSGFRGGQGGIAYWSGGPGDSALTAYALEFLLAARLRVPIDEEFLAEIVEWLAAGQEEDGRWRQGLLERRAPMITAVSAAALSGVAAAAPGAFDSSSLQSAITRAVTFLQARPETLSDPAVAASLMHTALRVGDEDLVDGLERLLVAQVTSDAGSAYWRSAFHTPYYGWGRSARLETTAAAIRALQAAGRAPDLVEEGLTFLMTEREGDGAWASTQATAQALRVLVAAFGDLEPTGGRPRPLLDEGLLTTVPDRVPATFSAEATLEAGAHRVSVAGASSPVLVQTVLSFRDPWPDSRIVSPDAEGRLGFAVTCPETPVDIGERIRCSVRVERQGSGRYGMMIAEIGLPPGVEVDRLSLDEQVAASGYRLGRYEVWPDRIIAYLWPGSRAFNFTVDFSPRLSMSAKSAPSRLYDYYNPDAEIVLPPRTFVVRPRPAD